MSLRRSFRIADKTLIVGTMEIFSVTTNFQTKLNYQIVFSPLAHLLFEISLATK